MAITGTGPFQQQGFGLHSLTSYATYSFYSNKLTTTDSFEDNILDFGQPLSQLWIVNLGSNAIAFQFPEFYLQHGAPLNTACGMVPTNDKIYFRAQFNKKGMKIRSLVDGSQSTAVYVFGI